MAFSIQSTPSQIAQFTDVQTQQMNKVRFYYNRGFLTPRDDRQEAPENLADFSLFTMKKVADFVAENGNALIGPHGMGIFQPRAYSALSYIRGSSDFKFPVQVYTRLFELTGEQVPSNDPLNIFQAGDAIFTSEEVSSAIKAQAIYMAIHDTLESIHDNRDRDDVIM